MHPESKPARHSGTSRGDSNRLVHNFRRLLELSHRIASILEYAEVPPLVTGEALALCGADEAILFLLDPRGETLHPAYYIGEHEEEVMRLRPRMGEGITGTVAAERRGEIVNHAGKDPRAARIPGTPDTPRESMLVVPLIRTDRLIGVLSLYKLEGRTFDQVDLDTINILATHAAIGIDTTQLFADMRAQRKQLVTMLEHMHDGVILGGHNGDVVLMNTAARAILAPETTPAEPGGLLLDLLDRPQLHGLRKAVIDVRSGETVHTTREVTTQQRTYRVSVSAVPGESPTDRACEVVLFHDLTNHRRFEAQLMASSKMSAVGQLAAGVAHEFNNLIAGIFGYAQLLKMNRDEAMVDRAANAILHASERAQQLTTSLLTFSRRNPGKRESVVLRELVDATLLLLERPLEKNNIRVIRDVPDLPPVIADPVELQQAVLNLVINAHQAIEDGGTIRIAGWEEGDAVHLAVEDSGPGIPREHLEKVFEPFFTTKGPLAGGKTPGTGLGLTSAYNIVKQHGGNLVADPDAAVGARFVLSLPATPPVPAPGGPAYSEGSPGDRPRTLVMERDPEAREQILAALTTLGHAVLAPETLDEAAQSLEEIQVEFAILDRLPEPGSDTLYARVRARNERTPIIFVAPRERGSDFPGLADPWAFLLRKPFRSRDLAALVNRVLTQRHRAAS